MGVNTIQVGGDHYKKGGNNQHWDFCVRHGVRYLEGCTSKYLIRWRDKNGRQDLQKTLHYIDKIIEIRLLGIYGPPLRKTNHNIFWEFCGDNKVGVDESRALFHIFNWDTVSDLELAKNIIRELMESFPGTPGDGGHHATQED